MTEKFYHVIDPDDYYIKLDSIFTLNDVHHILKCKKVIEVSESEYFFATSPNFYAMDRARQELLEALKKMEEEIEEQQPALTKERISEIFKNGGPLEEVLKITTK